MKNVSNQFRNELFNGNRNFIKSADIKLKDGTVLHVDNSKLWQNGLKIEDSVSSSSSFDIGSAIIGQLTITLNNIYDEYSEYDFSDAEISNIKVGLKLPDDTIESLSYGIYTVSDTNYNGSIITLTAYDNMYKFDIPYSKSTLSYPATLGAIVRDACSVCNVQLGTPSFDNDSFLVNERPTDDSITFRNVLLWVAQISCNYLKTDPYGKLLLEWYNTSIFENVKIISGGKYNPWDTDKSYDGGTFSPWTTGNISIDGGSFSDKDFHNIYNWSSFPNITTDDVIITGVKVIDDVETEEGTEQVTYQSGEDGYVIGIEGNKLVQGKGEEVCSFLGKKLIGLTFRPFSGNCLSDPTIETGDFAIISDRKGNSYKTFITSNTFQPGNFQSISCDAETPLRNSASRFSKATQVWVDSRKELQKQKTEWEKAMEELTNRVNNSSGLYMTSEEQPDGSSIYYMHDKPTLEESMIVWKMTAEAMAVSTDGGKTYNAGLTVDGTLIAKIMNTIGINFDWGVGGSLIIKDVNDVETLFIDAETGVVRIVADSFTLRGKTIEEITSDQLNDFIDSVYDPKIADLQKQIDGQIETYYYDYEPSLSNEPASSWETEEERSRHEGDLFYWKSKGYAYRFFKDGSVWKWQMVQDTDVTKALQQAAEAQDTADSKRRVFVSTPQPPYDIGDLWVQGTNGDIMRCQNARTSGTYVSSDWVKASKYTDDTYAEELDLSLNQQGVFNRLTNNGKVQGIFLQNGQLYFNGQYIQANTIRISSIAGSDLSNIATVTEMDESTMLPANFRFGGTKRHNQDGIWELQRLDYSKSEYLMLCDFTPNRFQTGDRIKFNFEFYLYTGLTQMRVAIWFYDADKNYVTEVTQTITANYDQWTQKEVEIEFQNMPNNAEYYLVGFGFDTTHGSAVRRCSVLPMIGGNLIVDNSITANKISINDLYALNASIGGWKINASNLKSPSGNLVMDSGAGTIYTIRQNGNKGVIFLDDGIELYSWALDGNFIGRISTGNFSDTLVQAVTFYSDYGDMIIFGMQTQAKDKTNIQVALSDRETNGYKIGINAMKTIHAFGDIYSRSKLYIGSSNANPYFQLNSDGGIFVSTSRMDVTGILSGKQVYSEGYRVTVAGSNNRIMFNWDGQRLGVYVDSTFLGNISIG